MSENPAEPQTSPAGDGTGGGIGWHWIGTDAPLFQRVASQIEQYITGNALGGGDRLPGERELSEQLGVSRASVREALRSLQARGTVIVRHGKGVFVAAPDEGDRALQRLTRLREVGLEELFAMREVLEVPAAGWAATAATDEQLRDLVDTFEQLKQAVAERRPPAQLQVADAGLHLRIAEYANNRFLAMTQSVLQEMLDRSMVTTLSIPGRPARSVREHAEIIEALIERNPAKARTAARRHIRSAHQAALRRVATEQARGPVS